MDSTLPCSDPASRPRRHGFWRWLAMLTLLTWATGCASLPPNDQRPVSTAYATPERTPLGELAAARRAEARTRSDSAFRLLDGVDIAFTSRLALIEGATRTLDLQYYAIHADATTEVLLRRLRAAAERGVRVRLLLDDFNSVGADAQVLRLAFVPNIEVRLFNPLPGPRNSLLPRILASLHDIQGMQKRMHNKLFIADNAWGITGGRNLGDRYFGGGDRQNFVDLDVLAAGRIVRDMSASFDRFWNDELAYPVQKLLDPEDLERLRKPEAVAAPRPGATPAAAAGGAPAATTPALAIASPAGTAPGAGATLPGPPPGGVLPTVTAAEAADAVRPPLNLRTVDLVWAPSTLMVDQPGKVGPGDDEVDAGDTVIDGLLSLMQQARSEVLIISPYFVPGARMMAAYQQLRARGVRVRVLTNSLASNDAPAAHAGYARYRERLLAMGVELYEMHSSPEIVADLLGSGSGSGSGSSRGGSGFGLGSGPGGSKAGTRSRASLHSKAVIIDRRLSIIGSMNLDLRSQLQNSEVALVVRSPALAKQAAQQIESTLASSAYRVEMRGNGLAWRAPPGAPFTDASSEPGASTKLKLLVKVIGPFAPEEML